MIDILKANLADGVVFNRHLDGKIKISTTALNVMLEFIQDDLNKPESGGVILGRHIVDSHDIVVDGVTRPTHEDQQSRFRFFRSKQPHQKSIDDAWAASLQTSTYLGEWHTHPEPIPTPSWVDKCNWHRKLMVDRYSGTLFFIILGTNELRVWEGQYRRITLYSLEASL